MIEPGAATRYRGLRDPEVRDAARFGARAARLHALTGAGLPVPRGFALPADLVAEIAAVGARRAIGPALDALIDGIGPEALLAIRASPPDTAWGGPPALLNLGITDATLPALAGRVGRRPALDLYRRLIQSWAVAVSGLDAEGFEEILAGRLAAEGVAGEAGLSEAALATLTAAFRHHHAEEAGEDFPQDRAEQVRLGFETMARAWDGASARILRAARGAPADAGLGLVVQRMALGLGPAPSGAGLAQFADETTGEPRLSGRFLPRAQGPDLSAGQRRPEPLGEDHAGAADLLAAGRAAAAALGDVCALEFTLEAGTLFVTDAEPARRTARAAVRIAVDLAEAGAIGRDDALLRIDPRSLNEHLHPQIDPGERRDRIARGLAASPGAASGQIVFTPERALALAAQDVASILVRTETSPEDIRGMQVARGLLTVRGGMSSHAAVIARGFGLPCVVGCSEIRLDARAGTLSGPDGRVFREGDPITLDGTEGEVLAGSARMIEAELSGAFGTLLGWADAARRLQVRANADTPQDARTARRFAADGIGLCRTEQMFFEADRINVMREMILAGTEAERADALARLLPMQRSDFAELFEIMGGLPVTIRFLDPPLHEFLPGTREELEALAAEMGLPVAKVLQRASELQEFNPMLGKRGVRLAVTMPEIYEMQARGVFEAALDVAARTGAAVSPEIMIPLVSAAREVELVSARVEAVAEAVFAERGARLDYRIGVMVETPRAALRAADLGGVSAFFSFGTNDLTQMTYGLSRDDAGRFMRDYVNQGVYAEDPFHALDLEGVGELLLMAAERGRAANPGLVLGLCGEHGGDPASVRFCDLAGFDYVSCSPYRMPIARLAAAQAAILRKRPA